MSAFFVDDLGVMAVVGQPAPDFELRTDEDRNWRLSDSRGHVTVLLFYPQNETLTCTKQLCSVRDHWSDYLATKASIVGISPATPDEHRSFSKSRKLPIPLLADPDRAITKIFAQHWFFPVSLTRGIVVIDAKGVIRNRDIMLRAFRPSDQKIITDIYAARVDAFTNVYEDLKTRASRASNQSLS